MVSKSSGTPVEAVIAEQRLEEATGNTNQRTIKRFSSMMVSSYQKQYF